MKTVEKRRRLVNAVYSMNLASVTFFSERKRV